jgi:hypothetical protein
MGLDSKRPMRVYLEVVHDSNGEWDLDTIERTLHRRDP